MKKFFHKNPTQNFIIYYKSFFKEKQIPNLHFLPIPFWLIWHCMLKSLCKYDHSVTVTFSLGLVTISGVIFLYIC